MKAPWQLFEKLISHRILSRNFWPNQEGARGRRNICKWSGKGVEKWNFARPCVGQSNIDLTCRLRQADLNNKVSPNFLLATSALFFSKCEGGFTDKFKTCGCLLSMPQPMMQKCYVTNWSKDVTHKHRAGAKWPHRALYCKGLLTNYKLSGQQMLQSDIGHQMTFYMFRYHIVLCALYTDYQGVLKENAWRNSGGTLRQKFNLIDI